MNKSYEGQTTIKFKIERTMPKLTKRAVRKVRMYGLTDPYYKKASPLNLECYERGTRQF